MAVAWGIDTVSLEAVSAVAVAQFTFLNVDSNGEAAKPTASAFALGVAQNGLTAAEATANVPVQIKFQGGTKVLTATSFAAGAQLMVDSDGKVLAASASTTVKVAVALEAATAANQIVSAIIVGPNNNGS